MQQQQQQHKEGHNTTKNTAGFNQPIDSTNQLVLENNNGAAALGLAGLQPKYSMEQQQYEFTMKREEDNDNSSTDNSNTYERVPSQQPSQGTRPQTAMANVHAHYNNSNSSSSSSMLLPMSATALPSDLTRLLVSF